jgi:hypothetical protein
VLRFLQCREPELVGRPFFAKFDENAAWFDELEPIDGQVLPWNSNGRLKLPSRNIFFTLLATSPASAAKPSAG